MSKYIESEWTIMLQRKYDKKIENTANHLATLFAERKNKTENNQYEAKIRMDEFIQKPKDKLIDHELVFKVVRQLMSPINFKNEKREWEIGFNLFSWVKFPKGISYKSEIWICTTENGSYFFDQWNLEPDTVFPIIKLLLQKLMLESQKKYSLDNIINFLDAEKTISK